MFCEKCGYRLESDDHFCPECGTKVVGARLAFPRLDIQTGGLSQKTQARIADASRGALPKHPEKIHNEVSDILSRLILSALGFFMLISTFLPFVSIETGTVGRIACAVFGKNLGNFGANLYGIKVAISGLNSLLNGNEYGKIDQLNNIVTIMTIILLVVVIMAVLSGLVNNKGFIMISGIASAICLIMWIVYTLYVSSIMEQLNSYLGNYAAIKGFYGMGLILMMITLALHAFLAIKKAINM